MTLLSIQINPSSAAIASGTTQAFTATGNYSDGSTKDLTSTATWSCLLPNLVTVSSNPPTQGLATAQPNVAGTAVITASYGTLSNGAPLTVTSATVTGLSVTPAAAAIGFENEQQFTATATFSDGTTQDVTNLANWSFTSFGPSITSYTGLATGTSLGTFAINASFGNQTTGFETTPPILTVDLSNLVSVAIAPASATVANHIQEEFFAIGTFSDGSTRDVSSLVTSWTSSDNAVATNYGATPGVFKAGAQGSTAISATLGNFSPTATLNVGDASLQSIALSPATATLAPTTKITYQAIGTFSDGSTQDLSNQVTWSVQDIAGAATITAKGILTGTSPGAVTVAVNTTANLGSVSATAAATVSAGVLQSIAVTPATAFITPGGIFPYSAVGTFSDGSTQDISTIATWSAVNTTVATMSSRVATAQGIGQSNITASVGGISGGGSLMVVPASQVSLKVTPAAVSVTAGGAAQLTATGTYTDGTTQDFTNLVTWSTNADPNSPVATVGYQSGQVTGVVAAAAAVTVTATVGSVASAAQVTIQ